jgi:Uma2 family endonuclease
MEDFATSGLLSVEEYLELEESATVKHEYVGGLVYALARASDRHNRISLNIATLLLGASRGGPCRVYMSDMRLRVAGVFYYPDVMVACEPPETENPTFRTDPCLVVEVLSSRTAAIDRREKLLAYRSIPRLRAYLILAQDRRHVERHWRGEDGLWRRAELVDDGQIPIPCPPETELTLADIYEGL